MGQPEERQALGPSRSLNRRHRPRIGAIAAAALASLARRAFAGPPISVARPGGCQWPSATGQPNSARAALGSGQYGGRSLLRWAPARRPGLGRRNRQAQGLKLRSALQRWARANMDDLPPMSPARRVPGHQAGQAC